MPAPDDVDPIQDAKHARETAADTPTPSIPAPTPTLAELHSRWMHARLKREQAELASKAATDALFEAEKEELEAVAPLATRLLADVARGGRGRSRTVAIAGEVLTVSDGGREYPGEFRITPMPVELVSLD